MENYDDLNTPLNISKKCLVCDTVTSHSSSICSVCGVSLRSKTIKNKNQTKKIKAKKCLVCDSVNPHSSSICSECGVSLRSKTIKNKNQTKKINKKKKKKEILKIKAKKCVGNKVTHPSKKHANKVREELFLKGRGSMIYYCNTCKGYHLTKQKS